MFTIFRKKEGEWLEVDFHFITLMRGAAYADHLRHRILFAMKRIPERLFEFEGFLILK